MNRALKIGILEGDDIGLEVVPECIKVIRAAARKAALDIEWHEIPIGRPALDTLGYTLPPGTLEWPATQPIASSGADPAWGNANCGARGPQQASLTCGWRIRNQAGIGV